MEFININIYRYKGQFFSFFTNILHETEYVEVASVEKHWSDWVNLEEMKTIKPFLDWFMNCITYENCLTSDELAL